MTLEEMYGNRDLEFLNTMVAGRFRFEKAGGEIKVKSDKRPDPEKKPGKKRK